MCKFFLSFTNFLFSFPFKKILAYYVTVGRKRGRIALVTVTIHFELYAVAVIQTDFADGLGGTVLTVDQGGAGGGEALKANQSSDAH